MGKQKSLDRAIFKRASKLIGNRFGFALFRLFVSENPRHTLNHSDSNQNQSRPGLTRFPALQVFCLLLRRVFILRDVFLARIGRPHLSENSWSLRNLLLVSLSLFFFDFFDGFLQKIWHFQFQVDSLKEICEGVLLRNIDEDNVLLYLGMAEQYSVARLKVGDA